MSSPMMKRMLGFCCCCAAAGRIAAIPTATNASRASHRLLRTFIEDLLTFRLGTGRAIEQPHMESFYCRREQCLRLKTSGDHAGTLALGPSAAAIASQATAQQSGARDAATWSIPFKIGDTR